jgi:ABC-type sugar transport system ATPase subunit
VDVRATSAHDHPSLIASITGENATSTGQQRRRGSVRSIPEAQPALSVRGLSTAHVHDIDIDVRRGEILGLAGLVGSGRTELARALFGLDHSRARTFTLAGQPFIPRSPRAAIAAGIALLPEDRRHEGLILDASVRENVTLSSLAAFRAKRRLPFPSRGRERASTLEHMRNLSIRTPSVEQPVGLLSGGNQQKVVIAKWLQVNPLVLLFDEPTQGIDVGAKEEVYRLIEALAEAGHGIVFISSEFSELVGTCHRVVVMREGTIVARLEGPAVNEETIVAACYRNDASAARERGTG